MLMSSSLSASVPPNSTVISTSTGGKNLCISWVLHLRRPLWTSSGGSVVASDTSLW